MRHLILGTLIPAHLIISGCSERGNAQAPAPVLTIEAQQVRNYPRLPKVGKHWMHGEFTIRTANPGERKISSSGTGGACLIAQFPGATKQCRQDSECDLRPLSPSKYVIPPPWHGYCVHNQIHSNTGLKGICWTKPSDDYCLKGPTVGVGKHYTPDVDTTEVYDEAKKRSDGRVRWAVLGCLNGVYSATEFPPCAARERIFHIGPVREVK